MAILNFTATILTEANAAVNFDTYRILQRHRAVSVPQQAVLVGRKRICDFLLVCNSNLGPKLHRL